MTEEQNPKRDTIPKAKKSTAHDWPKGTSGTAFV